MTAEEAANAIKEWAIKAGVVYRNRTIVAEPTNAQAYGAALATMDEHTDEIRRRGFNYITFDEEQKVVTVFTAKKITAKAKKNLPAAVIAGGITVEFEQGGVAYAGGPIPPPTPNGPYFLKNGKYACGSSVFVGDQVGAGTLGCLLKDAANVIYGFSNNHVTGACSYAEKGLPILAPGAADVSAAHIHPFTIGVHNRLLEMVPGHPTQVKVADNVDAAVFLVSDPASLSSYQGAAYDTPVDIEPLAKGMMVEKVGRTTGHTNGMVVGKIAGAEPVQYEVPHLQTRQIVFYDSFFVVKSGKLPFSAPGDSGSLVTTTVAGVRKAVGFVFAGEPTTSVSYVLPIGPILTRLGLSLVSGHNV